MKPKITESDRKFLRETILNTLPIPDAIKDDKLAVLGYKLGYLEGVSVSNRKIEQLNSAHAVFIDKLTAELDR